mgnify:CR=1 FL=1
MGENAARSVDVHELWALLHFFAKRSRCRSGGMLETVNGPQKGKPAEAEFSRQKPDQRPLFAWEDIG